MSYVRFKPPEAQTVATVATVATPRDILGIYMYARTRACVFPYC
jgi:hypothetical protein